MEIRKDFAARLEDRCRTIPPESIAMLLRALLPKTRTPVTRPAQPMRDLPEPPRTVTKVSSAAKARKLVIRTTSSYVVLKPRAYRNHRAGTWRHAMVHAAVISDNTQSAFEALRVNYPQHASKGIDFGWCAAQGYIEFN